MWKSILCHVSNKHKFKRLFPKYPQCRHRPYTNDEASRKKWIKKGSAAYNALEDVINNPQDLKDMEKLTEPYHTGSIEVFHSLLTAYAPKRQVFELNVMDARVKLAIIDHNSNVGRQQAVVKKSRTGSRQEGEPRWKFVSSKLSKEWTAKEVKEPKSYDFAHAIVKAVIEKKRKGDKVNLRVKGIPNRLIAPRNIAFTERPDVVKILEKKEQVKRFKK